MKRKIVATLLVFLFVLLVDRVTKYYALQNFVNNYKINDYLSFDLSINRGISWSLFDSQNVYVFIAISVVIFLVLVSLFYYSFLRFKDNKNIFAEALIISGGSSNLIDRILYSGVVDFIVLSYNNWYWPSFNFADIFIVFGLLIMLIKKFKE